MLGSHLKLKSRLILLEVLKLLQTDLDRTCNRSNRL